MCKIQLSVIAVLVTLSVAAASPADRVARAVQPSGKCDTYRIEPIELDYKELVGMGTWHIVYVTDTGANHNVDQVYINVTPKSDDDMYKADVVIVTNDNSKYSQTYTQMYIDKYLTEDAIDEKGRFHHHHIYPLAKSPEGCILWYRCSDSGRVPVDTRYVTCLEGKELSESGKEVLFKADKMYKFRGELTKLPYALV